MSDLIPPVPGTEHGVYSDPAKVSPKVIAATVLALLVPGILAVITYVGANQDVLGINNPVLGVLVVTLISGAVTFLAGYAKTDPLREAGRLVTRGNLKDANNDGRDDQTGRFLKR